MNTNRFIQISTLTTYPASLLNRDDSGLSKRIPFGGVSRTRVSSQCLKRHWRMAEGTWSLQNVDDGIATSVRSRNIFPRRVEQPLAEEGLDLTKVVAASQVFQNELYGEKGTEAAAKKQKAKKGQSEEAASEATLSPQRKELIVLGHPEIQFLKNAIRDLCAAGTDAEDTKKKTAEWFKEHKKDFQALKCGAGLDAAMFGRFVSGDPDARVSAAVHVAHAFTVHAEESETDYFTAVDDLDTAGTAHINATELTSGIFYTYVVIDVPQLVSNIEGCTAGEWLKADRTVAARLVKHMLHLITTVTPGAKLGSTAPYARPWFVLAEAGDVQPRTLADAFFTPVPLHGNMRAAALTQLAQYVADSDAMYGDSKELRRWMASMYPSNIPGAEKVSVDAMGDALENCILYPER